MPQWEKKEMRALLYLVQQGCCIWCGDMMNFNRRKSGAPARDFPTLEHIERKADGGPLDLTNIVLAHAKCNYKRNVEHQAAAKQGRVNQQNRDENPPHFMLYQCKGNIVNIETTCQKCKNNDPEKFELIISSSGYRHPTPSNPSCGSATWEGERCTVCGLEYRFNQERSG